MKAILKTQKNKEVLIKAIESIDTAIITVENKMIRLRVTGTGQDDVRFPAMLASRMSHLASDVAVSDFPPTDQDQEVYKLLHGRLVKYSGELQELMQGRFSNFLKILSAHNTGPVITD